MELKSELKQPYTDEERADFIVENNHQHGYEIRETEESIQAWGLTQEEAEEEARRKEAERKAMLHLTKREVFLALYNDKGITPEQIKSQITEPQALIEFEYANDFYRGNPLIDVIGGMLGYSTEQLDYLFENGTLPVSDNDNDYQLGE
jgi:hypothetical protein